MSANVASVNAIQVSRAQLVSAKVPTKPVSPTPTPYATAGGNATAGAVNVMKDISLHIARPVLAALMLARLNCKECKIVIIYIFLIFLSCN